MLNGIVINLLIFFFLKIKKATALNTALSRNVNEWVSQHMQRLSCYKKIPNTNDKAALLNVYIIRSRKFAERKNSIASLASFPHWNLEYETPRRVLVEFYSTFTLFPSP